MTTGYFHYNTVSAHLPVVILAVYYQHEGKTPFPRYLIRS